MKKIIKKQTKKHAPRIVNECIQSAEEIKKSVTKECKHIINVLGNKVYVMDINTIIRIGHKSKIIQCNELFVLLDDKVKQLLVLVTKNLINENVGDERYTYANKIAINKMIAKYPKVEKIYWLFAFRVIFGNEMNMSLQLNLNRLRQIIKLLKITKNKTAKDYIKYYEGQIKFDDGLIYGEDVALAGDLDELIKNKKSNLKVTPMNYAKKFKKKIPNNKCFGE